MLIALYNNQRVRAEMAGSGSPGTCPWTRFPVKAHVGLIRQYWAYVGGQPSFLNGYEPESEWHISWKTPVQDQYCEVVMGANNEHRADILGAENTVIEIQRSVIDIRDSRDRIDFYKNATCRRVIWIVDIQEFWRTRFVLSSKPDSKGFYTVTWKPRRTWLWDIAATPDTHLFLEFNQSSDKLLQAWIHQGAMFAKFVTKREFFMRYLNGVAKPEYVGFTQAADCVLRGVAQPIIPPDLAHEAAQDR